MPRCGSDWARAHARVWTRNSRLQNFATGWGPSMLKRAFDATLAAAGLVASAPLWAVFAAAIKLEDGGPVFFSQDRVGLGGRTFTALKFRSMRPDAEAATGAVQAAE